MRLRSVTYHNLCLLRAPYPLNVIAYMYIELRYQYSSFLSKFSSIVGP